MNYENEYKRKVSPPVRRSAMVQNMASDRLGRCVNPRHGDDSLFLGARGGSGAKRQGPPRSSRGNRSFHHEHHQVVNLQSLKI